MNKIAPENSPIIIIGMHRSGTSMITRMLAQLGLFVGADKDGNEEANFFQKLNDWAFRQAGGSWGHPEAIHLFMQQEKSRKTALEFFDYTLHSPSITSFMGWRNYLQYHNLEALSPPWGWKDPRNTFTLPLWLELFPEAKVIHIYRNGIDVAQSLKVRWQQNMETNQQKYEKWKRLYAFVPKWYIPEDSVRCSSLQEGFALWETYVHQAQRHVQLLGSNAIEIKFEDFLANPVPQLRDLSSFCELDSTDSAITELANKVKTSRSGAYKQDRALLHFSQSVSERLERFGYS